MNTENITNADLVAVFKQAKADLGGRCDMFICNCIYGANLPGAAYAEKLIMHRIAPKRTVTSWLVANGHTTWEVLLIGRKGFADFGPLALEYRLLWLDSLIKEFSSYDPAGNPPPLES